MFPIPKVRFSSNTWRKMIRTIKLGSLSDLTSHHDDTLIRYILQFGAKIQILLHIAFCQPSPFEQNMLEDSAV